MQHSSSSLGVLVQALWLGNLNVSPLSDARKWARGRLDLARVALSGAGAGAGTEATTHVGMVERTVHIVSLRLVIFRHGQQQASGVRLGQMPVIWGVSVALNNRGWDPTIFINNDK